MLHSVVAIGSFGNIRVAGGMTQTSPELFVTPNWLNERKWLVRPDGKPFFSLGLNSFDPARLGYR